MSHLVHEFDRPLAFYDLETTELDKQTCGIVEICVIRLEPHDPDPIVFKKILNPEMPITAGATEVHGITDAMVQDKPTFGDIKDELLEVLAGCYIIGFNSIEYDDIIMDRHFLKYYDMSLINGTYAKCVFDFRQYYIEMYRRTLSAIYERHVGAPLDGAHRAEVDVAALIEVFFTVISQNGQQELSMQELQAISVGDCADLGKKLRYNEDGQLCYATGKHRDAHVMDVHSSYADWFINKSDYHKQSKIILSQYMKSFKKGD